MVKEEAFQKKRTFWNDEEDARLVELVKEHGIHNWPEVASCLQGRDSKSCSLRWRYFLAPHIIRSTDQKLSDWEVAVLVWAQREYGNKWRTIVDNYLPWRSPNDLKNYCNQYVSGKHTHVVTQNKLLLQNIPLSTLLAHPPADVQERWQRIKLMQGSSHSSERPIKKGTRGLSYIIRQAAKLKAQRLQPYPRPTAACPSTASPGWTSSALTLPRKRSCSAALYNKPLTAGNETVDGTFYSSFQAPLYVSTAAAESSRAGMNNGYMGFTPLNSQLPQEGLHQARPHAAAAAPVAPGTGQQAGATVSTSSMSEQQLAPLSISHGFSTATVSPPTDGGGQDAKSDTWQGCGPSSHSSAPVNSSSGSAWVQTSHGFSFIHPCPPSDAAAAVYMQQPDTSCFAATSAVAPAAATALSAPLMHPCHLPMSLWGSAAMDQASAGAHLHMSGQVPPLPAQSNTPSSEMSCCSLSQPTLSLHNMHVMSCVNLHDRGLHAVSNTQGCAAAVLHATAAAAGQHMPAPGAAFGQQGVPHAWSNLSFHELEQHGGVVDMPTSCQQPAETPDGSASSMISSSSSGRSPGSALPHYQGVSLHSPQDHTCKQTCNDATPTGAGEWQRCTMYDMTTTFAEPQPQHTLFSSCSFQQQQRQQQRLQVGADGHATHLMNSQGADCTQDQQYNYTQQQQADILELEARSSGTGTSQQSLVAVPVGSTAAAATAQYRTGPVVNTGGLIDCGRALDMVVLVNDDEFDAADFAALLESDTEDDQGEDHVACDAVTQPDAVPHHEMMPPVTRSGSNSAFAGAPGILAATAAVTAAVADMSYPPTSQHPEVQTTAITAAAGALPAAPAVPGAVCMSLQQTIAPLKTVQQPSVTPSIDLLSSGCADVYFNFQLHDADSLDGAASFDFHNSTEDFDLALLSVVSL